MNTKKTINVFRDDDEISLWDVLNCLKKGWRWLASGLMLGVVCAVAYLAVTPKQYEAQALLHGAKVLGAELESPAQLIERMKFPTFYNEAQTRACEITTPEQDGDRGSILGKRVSPSILKGTNILQVTY